MFWFIEPRFGDPPVDMVRVATDRPCDYGLGHSTMEEIQDMACQADTAGQTVYLHAVRRPRFADVVYDLYEEVL